MAPDWRTIRVEFYGIPRARAGVAETTIGFAGDAVTFAYVLQKLAARFPALATDCLSGDGLRDGYAANLGGMKFVRGPEDRLSAGDTLLIFSADAGG